MSTFNDADALLKRALEALKNSQHAEAEALQRKAVDLLRQTAPGEARISRALEGLAGIHFVQGKFELAANEYQAVLQFDEERLPEDGRVVWRVLYWLGMSRFKHQNYEAAETNLRRALSVAETLPNNALDLAASVYQLGFVLYFVGKYQAAEPYLLRALSLYESSKGLEDPCTIEALTRIALTYEHCPAIGNDPEPYLRLAVSRTNPEGELRQAHIESLCRLAEHVAKLKKFEEADELFGKLLNLLSSEDAGQSDSHWVISDCIKYFKSCDKAAAVSELLAREQSYDAFGEITENRLKFAEQSLSEDDPEFAEALFASANHLMFKAQYEQAEVQLRRALECYEKIHGAKSLQVVTALNRLCVVTRLLKKYDEAGSAIDAALLIARENFPDHFVFPKSLENLALLRKAEGKTDEGTKIHAQSVAEIERVCGFPSYETAEAYYRQSGHLFTAGEFAAAEASIRRAMSAMDEIAELSRYEKSDYYSTLASILKAQGRQEEGTEMSEQAQELLDRGDLENRSED